MQKPNSPIDNLMKLKVLETVSKQNSWMGL